MDKCPKCDNYDLDYDVATDSAICTNKGCGFKEKINEEAYILLYGTLEHYTCFGSKRLEDRTEYIARFYNNRQKSK